jgi:hypothetical protein
MLVVLVQDADEGACFQEPPRVEGTAEGAVVGGVEGDWEGKSRFKIRDLLADGRCSRAVLDFLSSTDVGKLVPGPVAEEDAQRETSEWKLQERREREEEGGGRGDGC